MMKIHAKSPKNVRGAKIDCNAWEIAAATVNQYREVIIANIKLLNVF